MGLLDRFTADDEQPDAWRVSHMEKNGGWSPVDGFEELDEPISEDDFRFNTEALDPGKYRLFAVENNMNRAPDDDVGWSFTIDPQDARASKPSPSRSSSGESAEVKELKRELQSLRAELQEDADDGGGGMLDNTDPESIEKAIEARLMVEAVNSDAFMSRHGEKLALSMFGADESSGGDSLDYDKFSDNPTTAVAFEAFNTLANEPEKVEQLGKGVGAGLGSFMSGLGAGQEQVTSDDVDVQEESDDVQEDATDRSGISAGPSGLDSLGSSDTETDPLATEGNDVAAEVVEMAASASTSSTDAQEDAGDAEDAAGESRGATTSDDRPMSANGASVTEGEETAQDAAQEPQEGPGELNLGGDDVDDVEDGAEGRGDLDGDGAADGTADQCQAMTGNNEQCGNPAEDGSDYCWLEAHGPESSSSSSAPVDGDTDGENPDPEAIAESL